MWRCFDSRRPAGIKAAVVLDGLGPGDLLWVNHQPAELELRPDHGSVHRPLLHRFPNRRASDVAGERSPADDSWWGADHFGRIGHPAMAADLSPRPQRT